MLLEETAKGTKIVKGFMPTFEQKNGFEGIVDCNVKRGKVLDYIGVKYD